jgi:formiminotetrahydrofolate cyclodeaminase
MTLSETPLAAYADRLASGEPTPGGGSAAALAGAIGAACAEMVANFTVGRGKYADVEAEVREVLGAVEAKRRRLLELVDEDATAYSCYRAAADLPKGSDAEKTARKAAIQGALKEAAGVPMQVVECCAEIIKLLPALAEKGNPNVLSDVGCALKLCETGLQTGSLNVEVNLSCIDDPEFKGRMRRRLRECAWATGGLGYDLWNAIKKRIAG